jgi:hypothetical protein
MISRWADPRTEDTIVYELLRTARDAADPQVIGTATFRDGRTQVDAPDEVAIAVDELLSRAFVDRIQADERPRGYRRSGRGIVDMLVPGMPEHFIARLRGLWLPYPDGSVVTARQAEIGPAQPRAPAIAPAETGPAVTDPAVRRGTLSQTTDILHTRPLVRANDPLSGLRGPHQAAVHRSDCGWIV